MTILAELKEVVEVDLKETIYDAQLLHYINMGLRYLANNAIPVVQIKADADWDVFTDLKDGDDQIVLDWLHLYTLQRFDKSLLSVPARGTQVWIDTEKDNLLFQLKAIYDRGAEK